MPRIIHRLEWAEQLNGWPPEIPHPSPRRRCPKQLGILYEKAVSHALGPEAKRGIWWQFRDINGTGLCQTDFIILGEIWAVILECKHTWTPDGMEQLRGLYIPVVEYATGRKAVGIQVCKHLSPQYAGPVYNDLESAVRAARTGQAIANGYQNLPRLVTLHWRGISPILKSSSPPTKEPAHVHV